jgi:hypothetical protein
MAPSRGSPAIAAPIAACIASPPMPVAIPVGCRLFTRIPCLASSAANALAIPRTANLLAV